MFKTAWGTHCLVSSCPIIILCLHSLYTIVWYCNISCSALFKRAWRAQGMYILPSYSIIWLPTWYLQNTQWHESAPCTLLHVYICINLTAWSLSTRGKNLAAAAGYCIIFVKYLFAFLTSSLQGTTNLIHWYHTTKQETFLIFLSLFLLKVDNWTQWKLNCIHWISNEFKQGLRRNWIWTVPKWGWIKSNRASMHVAERKQGLSGLDQSQSHLNESE